MRDENIEMYNIIYNEWLDALHRLAYPPLKIKLFNNKSMFRKKKSIRKEIEDIKGRANENYTLIMELAKTLGYTFTLEEHDGISDSTGKMDTVSKLVFKKKK